MRYEICGDQKIDAKKLNYATDVRVLNCPGLTELPAEQKLDMNSWHGPGWDADKPDDCGTTHCLAGWAQALSTDKKIRHMSPQSAGSLLLPTRTALFSKSTEVVMDHLKGVLAAE